MTRTLNIIDRGATFVVRGDALKLLEAGGFRGIYTGVSRGWVLDNHRLPDVCAYLDSRGIRYQIRRGDHDPKEPGHHRAPETTRRRR